MCRILLFLLVHHSWLSPVLGNAPNYVTSLSVFLFLRPLLQVVGKLGVFSWGGGCVCVAAILGVSRIVLCGSDITCVPWSIPF